jgi:hypothetical protein
MTGETSDGDAHFLPQGEYVSKGLPIQDWPFRVTPALPRETTGGMATTYLLTWNPHRF